MCIVKNNNLFNLVYFFVETYPAPINITYFWNFSIFALVCLCIQLLTSMLFVMYSVPNIDLTFNIVEYLMFVFNVYSMCLIVVHPYLFICLFFRSYIYSSKSLCCIGLIMLIVMIETAFFVEQLIINYL